MYPGIRVDDSGTALSLAGDAYFALFFSMGHGVDVRIAAFCAAIVACAQTA